MKRLTFILLLLAVSLACTKEENNETSSSNLKLANKKNTGSSANDLLSDTTFKSLVVEVIYVEGFEPTQTALNNFVSFLNNRTFKPNGITIEKRAIKSQGKSTYTTQDIINIEDVHRTKYNTNNQIAVWVFFADGASANNTNSSSTLGVAYRNTSFVIFEETIHNLSDSPFKPNRSVLETTVINHEFGHLLGLTNLGTAMTENHEDTQHAKHCNNENCLMYWSAESGSGISNLIGANSAPQLDAQCIADLQANGGK